MSQNIHSSEKILTIWVLNVAEVLKYLKWVLKYSNIKYFAQKQVLSATKSTHFLFFKYVFAAVWAILSASESISVYCV